MSGLQVKIVRLHLLVSRRDMQLLQQLLHWQMMKVMMKLTER